MYKLRDCKEKHLRLTQCRISFDKFLKTLVINKLREISISLFTVLLVTCVAQKQGPEKSDGPHQLCQQAVSGGSWANMRCGESAVAVRSFFIRPDSHRVEACGRRTTLGISANAIQQAANRDKLTCTRRRRHPSL